MRKEQIKKGVITQKMMSFRIDYENWKYICTKENKGRYINELIKKDRE